MKEGWDGKTALLDEVSSVLPSPLPKSTKCIFSLLFIFGCEYIVIS